MGNCRSEDSRNTEAGSLVSQSNHCVQPPAVSGGAVRHGIPMKLAGPLDPRLGHRPFARGTERPALDPRRAPDFLRFARREKFSVPLVISSLCSGEAGPFAAVLRRPCRSKDRPPSDRQCQFRAAATLPGRTILPQADRCRPGALHQGRRAK